MIFLACGGCPVGCATFRPECPALCFWFVYGARILCRNPDILHTVLHCIYIVLLLKVQDQLPAINVTEIIPRRGPRWIRFWGTPSIFWMSSMGACSMMCVKCENIQIHHFRISRLICKMVLNHLTISDLHPVLRQQCGGHWLCRMLLAGVPISKRTVKSTRMHGLGAWNLSRPWAVNLGVAIVSR